MELDVLLATNVKMLPARVGEVTDLPLLKQAHARDWREGAKRVYEDRIHALEMEALGQ